MANKIKEIKRNTQYYLNEYINENYDFEDELINGIVFSHRKFNHNLEITFWYYPKLQSIEFEIHLYREDINKIKTKLLLDNGLEIDYVNFEFAYITTEFDTRNLTTSEDYVNLIKDLFERFEKVT